MERNGRAMILKRFSALSPAARAAARVAVIVVLIALSAVLGVYFHLVLHTDVIYTHFLYIPIVIASMWWGRRGIVVAVVLAVVVGSFHLLGIAIGSVWGDLARVLFFVLVAVFVSYLREKVASGQEALRSSEEKYRMLIEESLSGILVYRGESIVFANERLGRVLHCPSSELVGRTIWDLFCEEDRGRVRRLVEESAEEGRHDLRYECRLLRGDGSRVWVDVARSTTGYEGEPAILMHIYDISLRKEEEAKRLELSELTRKQEEQLVHSTRLAELGEMAAAISHELNQPLTGIRNYARNAYYMMENDAGEPGQVMENLRLISDQVDRASKIINQMRELARRSELHFTTLDINGVIRESVEFLMSQMQLSEVEITLDLDEELPEILGDWIRLEQVLLNLLANARQAMEDSPVRRLTVSSRREADFVVIDVRDTGKGFAEEEADRLFTPFYTTKKPGEGTGLGLSISLRIIQDHGGTLKAEGRSGQGAAFTVRLPVSGKAEEDAGQRGE